MKTPRYFSPAVTRSLLPEKIGVAFPARIMAVAASTGHQCAVSGYPYPPSGSGNQKKSWLMLEPRLDNPAAKAGTNATLLKDPAVVASEIAEHGITAKTVQTVCPLYFYARHTDLAIEQRKGTLIFAPWITQSELLHLFRGLMIASTQAGTPAAQDAQQALEQINGIIGNEEVLAEVTAFPPTMEWSSLAWLKAVRRLAQKERRLYLRKFAGNLRLWPDPDAFRPLAQYWLETSQATNGRSETESWLSFYRDMANGKTSPMPAAKPGKSKIQNDRESGRKKTVRPSKTTANQ